MSLSDRVNERRMSLKRRREEQRNKEFYDSIVYAVINRHFNFLSEEQVEDAYMEGILKIYDLLAKGHYDESFGPLYNFLYKGVWNVISNFVRKENSFCFLDDIGTCVISDVSIDCEVPYLSVDKIVSLLYPIVLSDDSLQKVQAYLNYLGLDTDSNLKFKDNSVDSEVTIILWKTLI